MAAIIQIAGFFNNVFGLVGFGQQVFPGGSGNNAVYRVAAGLNGNGLSSADGALQQIKSYDVNQNLLGSAWYPFVTGYNPDGYISSGDFKDFTIGQTSSEQALIAQFFADTDAICIPYISATLVDNSQYAWVGDWGKQCGLDWYPSGVAVPNSDYYPACTWIDGNHSNGIKADMLMINFASFVNVDTSSTDPSSLCGYPAFRAYTDEASTEIFKREFKPDTRLVVSNHSHHNATEVCTHPNSLGPDFVSLHEGVFCDMMTRTTLPLCSKAITKDCYDLDNHMQVGRRGISRRSYTEVITWDPETKGAKVSSK